jgi:hypothetical protein
MRGDETALYRVGRMESTIADIPLSRRVEV